MSKQLYLNGILCNGSGRGVNEYTISDLKEIAKEKRIHIPSGLKKEEICKLIIAESSNKKQEISKSNDMKLQMPSLMPKSNNMKPQMPSLMPKSNNIRAISKQEFKSIEELMESYGVDDARDLLGFSESELEDIIVAMKVYTEDNKTQISMNQILRNYTGSERVKRFLIILADKFCRCLKKVEEKSKSRVYSAVGVCSSSIFSKKGLKGPGRSFQCTPTPLLLSPQTKHPVVLEKSDKLTKK